MDLPLLQAGVDINTIRAWLGHVSLDTTHIYDLAAKAKALARCEVAPALDITPGAKMLACVVPALTIAAHNAEIHRPRTAEGKARSSRNSTVHGLTSKSPILPGDDPAGLLDLAERCHADPKPDGAVEEDLVERMAIATYCLRRIASKSAT